jgi:hypothetical protein
MQTSSIFLLGPDKVPYLIDLHHAITIALHFSGFHNVKVTLKMVCNWSHDLQENMLEFFKAMAEKNFTSIIGRPNNTQEMNCLCTSIQQNEFQKRLETSLMILGTALELPLVCYHKS